VLLSKHGQTLAILTEDFRDYPEFIQASSPIMPQSRHGRFQIRHSFITVSFDATACDAERILHEHKKLTTYILCYMSASYNKFCRPIKINFTFYVNVKVQGIDMFKITLPMSVCFRSSMSDFFLIHQRN
jgi:hypothetical protein